MLVPTSIVHIIENFYRYAYLYLLCCFFIWCCIRLFPPDAQIEIAQTKTTKMIQPFVKKIIKLVRYCLSLHVLLFKKRTLDHLWFRVFFWRALPLSFLFWTALLVTIRCTNTSKLLVIRLLSRSKNVIYSPTNSVIK